MFQIGEYIASLQQVLSRLPLEDIETVVGILRTARTEGRMVFLFGNGGSAATASHIACDLSKGTLAPGQPRLRVLALNESVPLMTAWSNDSSYDVVFREQISSLVQPGNVVIGISGSGNSPNIVAAMQAARDSGAITIGLIGFDGGALKHVVEHSVIVPSDSQQIVEDAHLAIGHAIALQLRDGLAWECVRSVRSALPR